MRVALDLVAYTVVCAAVCGLILMPCYWITLALINAFTTAGTP